LERIKARGSENSREKEKVSGAITRAVKKKGVVIGRAIRRTQIDRKEGEIKVAHQERGRGVMIPYVAAEKNTDHATSTE